MADSLDLGMTYVFKLQVSDNSNVFVYKVQFYTLSNPVNGKFLITPTTGIEFSTVFKLETFNWTDSDYSILTYQFGYNLSNQSYSLNVRNQSAYFYCQLPASSSLIVWVKVVNSVGGYSLKTLYVNVTKNNGDLSSLSLIQLNNYLNSPTSQISNLPNIITQTTIFYLSNSSISSFKKEQVYSNLLTGIDTLISNSSIIQSIDIENILGLLSTVVNSYNSTYSNNVVSRLYKLLDLSVSSGIVVDAKQLGYYTNIIQNCTNFNSTVIYNNVNTLATVNNALKSVLTTAGLNMVYGQSISYQTSQVFVHSAYYSSATLTNYTSPIVPGYSGSIKIPTFEGQLQGDIQTAFILYNDNGRSASNKSLPTAIDFSLTRFSNFTNSSISLTLKKPLTLTLPIFNNKNRTIECVYLKNN